MIRDSHGEHLCRLPNGAWIDAAEITQVACVFDCRTDGYITVEVWLKSHTIHLCTFFDCPLSMWEATQAELYARRDLAIAARNLPKGTR